MLEASYLVAESCIANYLPQAIFIYCQSEIHEKE
jgi:hypothetical protein